METGSAITWKYPSCILRGDNSQGEFYSIAVSNGMQQVDSGTKMIHLGKNTSSRIISKGISAGKSSNCYRGLVSAHRKGDGFAQLYPVRQSADWRQVLGSYGALSGSKTPSAQFEHEATTSKISEDQLFYCMQRGMNEEEAVALHRQRFCARRAAASAHGIHGRKPETDRYLVWRGALAIWPYDSVSDHRWNTDGCNCCYMTPGPDSMMVVIWRCWRLRALICSPWHER